MATTKHFALKSDRGKSEIRRERTRRSNEGEEEGEEAEEVAEERANPLATLSRFSQTEEMRNRFAWPFHSVRGRRGRGKALGSKIRLLNL